MRRICIKCGTELNETNWFKSCQRDYIYICKECCTNKVTDYHAQNIGRIKKRSHEYYLANKARIAEYHKKYREDHKEERRILAKDWIINVEKEVLTHYGGKCVCCGENLWWFLTLSHPNNDGNKQRKELGGRHMSGYTFYLWLKRHNYPTDYEIVVECFCCNMAKQRNNGVCPHSLAR